MLLCEQFKRRQSLSASKGVRWLDLIEEIDYEIEHRLDANTVMLTLSVDSRATDGRTPPCHRCEDDVVARAAGAGRMMRTLRRPLRLCVEWRPTHPTIIWMMDEAGTHLVLAQVHQDDPNLKDLCNMRSRSNQQPHWEDRPVQSDETKSL